MSKKFAHLHCHTTYSILDGISRREDLIKKTKDYGMDALAITEHGSMFNAISFYKNCVDANIRPILGMEAYIAPDSRKGRDYATKDAAAEDAKNGDLSMSAYHLTLLAKNRTGYDNLKKLSTLAYREGFYRKPRIDDEILKENKEGLIVLSGCLAGKIARLICAGSKDKALEEIDKMRAIFGDDFYLEMMHHGISEDSIVNEALIEFSNKTSVGLVMTGDSHFTERGDEHAHDIALAIGTGKTINEPNRFRFNGEGYWFKSPEEMKAAALDGRIPQSALDNAANIADSIKDYAFTLNKPIIPLFKDNSGTSLTNAQCDSYLDIKANLGLASRGFSDNPVYIERLAKEIALIKKKEFSSYFLIIADIVDFMRTNNMPMGVGRGSAGGSLLCYCLSITGLDPIELNLPFSRFINEGRNDLPDIDTDISQERRKEVINYIVNKYGKDRVAQIVTFQSMAAKAAIDNVGRALAVPSTMRRSISHLIGETDKDDKVHDLVAANNEVKAIMDQTPSWLDVSERLEGNNRNLGAHAAGITITNGPITDYVPLVKDSADGFLVTQYDMKDIEKLGLLKLDMLGVKTLDVIKQALDLVKDRHGLNIDMQRIDRTDRKTYQMLATGKFVSVFQYDSHGFRSMLRQLVPENFEHLIAANSLYRPGPMLKGSGTDGRSILENYISRRHGQEAIKVWHEDLREIFAGTYGLPLFQEQIMGTAMVMSRFTESEADGLRHAIGKKNKAEFTEQMDKFVVRGVENGHKQEDMVELAGKMAGSARYNWNRSHGAAYSYISYITAWLEANYPLEYYTALLNVNLGDNDQLKVLLSAILQKGVKILPPHINHSGELFRTDGTAIYMGLYSIKQVGEKSLPSIIEDREKNGQYTDYLDFCIRISPHGRVTKVTKENIVKAGGFTWDTSLTAKEKVENTVLIQEIIKKFEGKVPPQEVRKHVTDRIVLTGQDYTQEEKLSLERTVLNFYISSHPTIPYQPLFNLFPNVNFIGPSQISEQPVGTKAVVLGVAEERQMKQTKNNDPYMAMKLGDQMGSQQINIWNPLCLKAYATTSDDQIVLLAGTIKEDKFRPGENQLSVYSVIPIHTLGGFPVTSFYCDDTIVANRICTTINAIPLSVSSAILNVGHAVILKSTAFIRPEHYTELSQYRKVHYSLAL